MLKLFLLLALFPWAPPPIPATYYRTVRWANVQVPADTQVQAQCVENTVNGPTWEYEGDSWYGPLDVLGHGDEPEQLGCFPDEPISFMVGDWPASATSNWQEGGGGRLNLSAGPTEPGLAYLDSRKTWAAFTFALVEGED